VFEIDMKVRPEFFGEFLPANQCSRLAQQHFKNTKGLVLQGNPVPRLAQLALFEINLEPSKTNHFGLHSLREEFLIIS